MLCKVCRDDLPAERFHFSEYQKARINCSIPVCTRCSVLHKRDRKARTRQTLAIMQPATNGQRDQIWYNLSADEKRQKQMANRTASEKRLEEALKREGVAFEVQFPIGPYWADFYLESFALVVEVDGSIHDTETQREHDARRTQHIEKTGRRVLRFTNSQVDQGADTVVQGIISTAKLFPPVTHAQRRVLNGKIKGKAKKRIIATIQRLPPPRGVVYVPPRPSA